MFPHNQALTHNCENQALLEFPKSGDSGVSYIGNYPLSRDFGCQLFPQSKIFPNIQLQLFPGLALLQSDIMLMYLWFLSTHGPRENIIPQVIVVRKSLQTKSLQYTSYHKEIEDIMPKFYSFPSPYTRQQPLKGTK